MFMLAGPDSFIEIKYFPPLTAGAGSIVSENSQEQAAAGKCSDLVFLSVKWGSRASMKGGES